MEEWIKVADSTWRLPVEGGWLYRYDAWNGASATIGLVFVPTAPGLYPHGEAGLCMSCLTLAIRDGLAGRGS